MKMLLIEMKNEADKKLMDELATGNNFSVEK
jgi:hypothetical protein